MIVVNISKEICVPPFGYGYGCSNRNSDIGKFGNIVRSKKYNLRLRVLLKDLRNNIRCVVIVQGGDELAFKGMRQFNIMCELRKQVWIALAIGKRIQEISERIQILVIWPCYTATIRKGQ